MDNADEENACGARLDVEQTEEDFNTKRGDGSWGQIENISVLSPTDDTTYVGTVTHSSEGDPAQFMLVFSGLDSNGDSVIYDHHIGLIDPEEGSTFEFEFTYEAPEGPVTEVGFPEIYASTLNDALVAEGT